MALDLPPVIGALSDISHGYDGYLVDQWGVLHNGVEVYPEALAALATLKAAGKSVLILSNSGRSGDENCRLMADMGIPRNIYDRVLSAGDDAFDALGGARDPLYRDLGDRALVLARSDDGLRVEELGYRRTGSVDEADFVFVISMDVMPAIPGDWLRVLRQARARGLPLICANPDLKRVRGEGQVLVAPGAVALEYERMGGVSHYHGKPHPRIYHTALGLLGIEAPRVLAIGDSLIHDVEGARAAGLDSLFILNGVHREMIDPARPETLSNELAAHAPIRPTWIADRLR